MTRLFAIMLACTVIFTACASGSDATQDAPVDTPVPSLTPTAPATPTPVETASPTITFTPSPTGVPLQFESEGLEDYPPPINIDLPDDWLLGYDIIVNPDIDGELRAFPVAVYQGPVTGGTGSIYLIWGFQSTTTGDTSPLDSTNIYRDGLRLWRFLLNGIDCNIGSDLQRDFTVGILNAAGTYVSAVDCPAGPDGVQEPDVSGWFAGVRVEGLPFIFFAFTDPQAILGPARDEMQAILDTVEFRVTEFLTTTPPAP